MYSYESFQLELQRGNGDNKKQALVLCFKALLVVVASQRRGGARNNKDRRVESNDSNCVPCRSFNLHHYIDNPAEEFTYLWS
jgi:hypothetical protein